MNRKEISEIRRRLNPDKNAISCIRGCYVNDKREIVSMFNRPLMSFPMEEAEKYLAIFRRVLSGMPGRNLIDITFRPDQVMEGAEHQLLSGMRNTALKVEQGVQTFFQNIIDSVDMEGHYLILLAHDAYDVPYHAKDEAKVDDASEEVFNYILCAVCPVKLTKPALSYHAEDNDFHERELDWVVAAPEMGFMFPAYEDYAANIYNALYFSRDVETLHDDFIAAVFNTDTPMPPAEQGENFAALLQETVGEDLSLDVVQAVHEQLRSVIDENKSDREAAAPCVTKGEIKQVLAACGVPEERVDAFDQRFDEDFGPAADLPCRNIIDTSTFEVRTPDVVIKVAPEHSDLIETRVIDGVRYILIRAEEGVVVNGMSVHTEAE